MNLKFLALTACVLLSAAHAATSAYTVKAGDTLYGIARANNLNMVALQAVNPRLSAGRALQIGQVVQLPVRSASGRRAQTATVRATGIRVNWSLPVNGVMTTGYNSRPNHAGIDIAARPGTPITVSQPGQVTESRYDARYGWGWTVVIDFGGGIRARYSHNQANLVRAGDVVQPGQVIARVGSTGNSTGPHVDYRVTVNGRSINPLSLQ